MVGLAWAVVFGLEIHYASKLWIGKLRNGLVDLVKFEEEEFNPPRPLDLGLR